MTLAELITETRRRLRDEAGGSTQALWSDDDLAAYANAARDRMFLKIRTICIDSTTASDTADTPLPLCVLPLTADVGRYAVSTKIIEIQSLQLASLMAIPLTNIKRDELNRIYPNWRTMPSGQPIYWCDDLDTGYIQIVPAPKASDTAYLTVSRMPLARLALGTTDLGIREEYQEDLIPWIMHLAFLKKDAETDRPDLAEYHRVKFEGADGYGGRLAEIKWEMKQRSSGKREYRASTFGV